jgi:hypothetical protein
MTSFEDRRLTFIDPIRKLHLSNLLAARCLHARFDKDVRAVTWTLRDSVSPGSPWHSQAELKQNVACSPTTQRICGAEIRLTSFWFSMMRTAANVGSLSLTIISPSRSFGNSEKLPDTSSITVIVNSTFLPSRAQESVLEVEHVPVQGCCVDGSVGWGSGGRAANTGDAWMTLG